MKKIKTAVKIAVNELTLISGLKNKRAGSIADLLTWQKRYPYVGNYGLITADSRFKKLANLLENEHKICLNPREVWNIYNCVLGVKNIEGDIAEIGVYKGGSAKLMAELETTKKIYLFDTFTGIPDNDFELNKVDDNIQGDSLEKVKNYLSAYKNLLFYEGIFPKSAESLDKNNLKFSFVHIDVDVYEGTYDSLAYFYPLLSKGGVILTHDYNDVHPGVQKAFDAFFKDKPETIQVAWDSTQAFVVKK